MRTMLLHLLQHGLPPAGFRRLIEIDLGAMRRLYACSMFAHITRRLLSARHLQDRCLEVARDLGGGI